MIPLQFNEFNQKIKRIGHKIASIHKFTHTRMLQNTLLHFEKIGQSETI